MISVSDWLNLEKLDMILQSKYYQSKPECKLLDSQVQISIAVSKSNDPRMKMAQQSPNAAFQVASDVNVCTCFVMPACQQEHSQRGANHAHIITHLDVCVCVCGCRGCPMLVR